MMKLKYLGELRVECEHVESGTKMVTDAPKDNHGKGETFSPTDLCAVALGSCVLTTLGIYAAQHGIDLTGAEAEIVKRMAPLPRRIVEIDVVMDMSGKVYAEKEKKILERVAQTCPVKLSLSEQMVKHIRFRW